MPWSYLNHAQNSFIGISSFKKFYFLFTIIFKVDLLLIQIFRCRSCKFNASRSRECLQRHKLRWCHRQPGRVASTYIIDCGASYRSSPATRDNCQLDAIHCSPVLDQHDVCRNREGSVPQINPNIIILSATGMTHKENKYLWELCVHII